VTKQLIESPCPVCGTIGVAMQVDVRELAYFGDHAQISLACEACGWRRTEFLAPEPSEPKGMRLLVRNSNHLAARLVRSSSSSVILPEIGLEVHPGSDATGYVTNVEGVLTRFLNQVRYVVEDSGSAEHDEATVILERLRACLEQPESSPLVLELLDPSGHAQLIHQDVESWTLTLEESSILPSVGISRAEFEDE